MLFSDMRQMVKDLAGDQDQVQFTNTQINRNLNQAQRIIAYKTECVEKRASFTQLDNVAGTFSGGVTLGTDFIRPRIVRFDGQILTEVSQDVLYPELTSVELVSTLPYGYYLTQTLPTSATARSRRMEFLPSQTLGRLGVNVEMLYIGTPNDMTADSDVSGLPELLHDAVVMTAFARTKLQENDYQGYQFIMQNEVTPMIAEAMYILGPSTANSFGEIRDAQGVSVGLYDGVWYS